MKQTVFSVLVLTFLIATSTTGVAGHGSMIDPPQRSSMYRFGFRVAPNYDSNALNCGGFSTQYSPTNQGRCGECGDDWSLPRPRPNEEGGIYGTGIIGKTYRQGSVVNVTVQITANHKGYFEFRLCPKSSAAELVTQECLNQNLLTLTDGSTKYYLPSSLASYYYPALQLPNDVTCNNCVLQWWYRTGNSWGNCGNGTGAIGCGNQETFVNCADIAIVP